MRDSVPRPVRRPPRTVAVTPDTLKVAVVAGAAAVVLAAVWWAQGRPEPGTTVPVGVSPSPAPAVAEVTGTGPDVVVDVRGAVRRPGIRRLPAGSRVIDAVDAAGGLRSGRAYGAVNLAAVLTDGQQILVGRATAQPGAPGSASPGTPDGPVVDLNTATEPELEALDGIGPVLAAQIVQWRTENGPFQAVDDLLDVSGIGEATLAGIRDQVTVG